MRLVIRFASGKMGRITSTHYLKSLFYKILFPGLIIIAIAPATVQARNDSISIVPVSALRFGTFVLPAAGTREVSPAGSVINSGIMPLPGDITGPAEFQLIYDRGNNGVGPSNKPPETVVIELSLLSVPSVALPGVTGTLSNFKTDLPGAATLQVGQIVPVTLSCATPICSVRFRIGGKLSVTRSAGGGALDFSLPLTATLISINGVPQ